MRSTLTLILAFLVLLTGCGKSRKSPEEARRSTAADEESVDQWLSIKSTPEALATARQHAEAASKERVDLLFAGLPEGKVFAEDFKHEIEQNQKRVIETVHSLLDSPVVTGPAKAKAALIVLRWNSEPARSWIVKTLKTGDVQTRSQLIRMINFLKRFGEEETPASRFLFEDPAVASALVEQLDHPSPQVVSAAIQTCGLLNIPGSVSRMLEMLAKPDVPDRGRIIFWVAQHGDLSVAIPGAQELLKSSTDRMELSNMFSVIRNAAERGSPEQRRWAIDAIRNVTLRYDLKLDNSDVSTWSLSQTLAMYADDDARSWMESDFERLNGEMKSAVLRALARLDAPSWKTRALALLTNDDVRPTAVELLGTKLAGTQDAAAAEHLSAAAKRDKKSEHAAVAIREALLKIGGPNAEQAAANIPIPDRDPWSAMEKKIVDDKLTREQIRDLLVSAGALTSEEFEAAITKVDSAPAEERSRNLVSDLLRAANRIHEFDAETDSVPCRHDQLVLELSEISKGGFRPTDVSERWIDRKNEEDFDADYGLSLVVGGHAADARLRNLGDWYDLERLIPTLNRLQEAAGQKGRFYSLYTGDQMASVIFLPSEGAALLQQKLGLPIEDDPGESRRTGVEFENAVIEELKKGGKTVLP